MSNITIGWDKDLADEGSQTTGTNTMLERFTAIEMLRVAGEPIPREEWLTLVNQLAEHMKSVPPETFLDGTGGKYMEPMVTALGMTVSAYANPAFKPTINSDVTIGNSQVFVLQASVPAGVNVDTVAWTKTGTATSITEGADTFNCEITADAANTGDDVYTLTVTDGNGTAVAETVTVTVA